MEEREEKIESAGTSVLRHCFIHSPTIADTSTQVEGEDWS
jgi:hypothetical protein